MSEQRKSTSLLETLCNTGSGFLVSMAVWAWIAQPLFGFESSFEQSVGIVILFTVSSIIRGYAWRRLFNYFTRKSNEETKDVHKQSSTYISEEIMACTSTRDDCISSPTLGGAD